MNYSLQLFLHINYVAEKGGPPLAAIIVPVVVTVIMIPVVIMLIYCYKQNGKPIRTFLTTDGALSKAGSNNYGDDPDYAHIPVDIDSTRTQAGDMSPIETPNQSGSGAVAYTNQSYEDEYLHTAGTSSPKKTDGVTSPDTLVRYESCTGKSPIEPPPESSTYNTDMTSKHREQDCLSTVTEGTESDSKGELVDEEYLTISPHNHCSEESQQVDYVQPDRDIILVNDSEQVSVDTDTSCHFMEGHSEEAAATGTTVNKMNLDISQNANCNVKNVPISHKISLDKEGRSEIHDTEENEEKSYVRL